MKIYRIRHHGCYTPCIWWDNNESRFEMIEDIRQLVSGELEEEE